MIQQAVSRMRNEFSDSLNRVIYQHEQIILERHGKPVAAILPFDEFERVKPFLTEPVLATDHGGEAPVHP